jgi:hypothetical protein
MDKKTAYYLRIYKEQYTNCKRLNYNQKAEAIIAEAEAKGISRDMIVPKAVCEKW